MYPKSTKKCLVCLSFRTNGLDLDDEPNRKRNISGMLSNHLGFLIINECDTKFLCDGCWNRIEKFHDFYQLVKRIHKKKNFDSLIADCSESLTIKIEPNPIDVNEETTKELPHANVIELKGEFPSSTDDHLDERTNAGTIRWKSDDESDDNNHESGVFVAAFDEIIEMPKSKCRKEKGKKKKKRKIEKKGPFTCDICQKIFGTLKELRYHMSNIHIRVIQNQDPKMEPNVKCSICSKILKSADSLRKHVRRLHDGMVPKQKERRHMCDICAKVYTSRSGLEKHLEAHTDIQETRSQCNQCQKWFKSATYVKEHVKRIHDSVHKPIACPHCGKMKPHDRSLKRHILECHTKPAHKCTFCDKSFVYANFLKEHIATHTGESLYTCWYCPFPFKNKSNMYKHMKRKHNSEYTVDRIEKLLKTKA